MTWDGFHAEVLEEKIDWQKGYIIPSTKPGLGITLNMDVVRNASPYKSKALHLSMDAKPYDYVEQSNTRWKDTPQGSLGDA